MFRITKIKVAGAIAAGAVALGAAGVYAANNGTISLTTPPKPVDFGANGPYGIVTLDGTAPTLENFKNVGDCVSFFAGNRDLALATSISSGNKLAKNFHGKLVSFMADWCRDHVTKSDSDASSDSAAGDASGSTQRPRR